MYSLEHWTPAAWFVDTLPRDCVVDDYLNDLSTPMIVDSKPDDERSASYTDYYTEIKRTTDPFSVVTLRTTRVDLIAQTLPFGGYVAYTAELTYAKISHIGVSIDDCFSLYRLTPNNKVETALRMIEYCMALVADRGATRLYIVGVPKSCIVALQTGIFRGVSAERITEMKATMMQCGYEVMLVHYSDRYKIRGCRVVREKIESTLQDIPE